MCATSERKVLVAGGVRILGIAAQGTFTNCPLLMKAGLATATVVYCGWRLSSNLARFETAFPFSVEHYLHTCNAKPGGNMIGASVIIGILITFLVIILVLYLVQRLPIDARMRQIVQIVVIIIGIVSLLKYLAVF
jgi:hypothetical protein